MPTAVIKTKSADGKEEIQRTITLNPDQLVRCGNCKGDTFATGQRIYKISRLLIGDPQDKYAFDQVKYCTRCGTMLEKHAPAEYEKPKKPGSTLAVNENAKVKLS